MSGDMFEKHNIDISMQVVYCNGGIYQLSIIETQLVEQYLSCEFFENILEMQQIFSSATKTVSPKFFLKNLSPPHPQPKLM